MAAELYKLYVYEVLRLIIYFLLYLIRKYQL
jgi:hypothetical protein